MTNNLWHVFHSHFEDAVGRVSLWFFPIKAANTSIMYNHDQIIFQLPDLHDLKLLTLRWRSFCHGCIHNMPSCSLALSIIHIVLAAFLAFSFTFLLITTLFFNNAYKYILKYTLQCLLIVDNSNLQNPMPFDQCSSSLAGLLNWLLWSST